MTEHKEHIVKLLDRSIGILANLPKNAAKQRQFHLKKIEAYEIELGLRKPVTAKNILNRAMKMLKG